MTKLLIVLMLCSCSAFGQAWSGIIASSRAANWSTAGLPATFPDSETTPNPWTPPTRSTICSTISSGASASTINSAISSCTQGEVVKLPCDKSITISSATLNLYATNDITLRGCGADQTTIYVPGSSYISWDNGNGSGSTTWTGGFSQGATSITVSSASGITAGQSVLTLQADSQTVDPGGPFTCADANICTTEGGVTSQYQNVLVTNVTGTTLTISPGLYMPNWSSLSSPTATVNHSNTYGIGLEDMTVDCTGNTTNACIYIEGAYASWMKGVRVVSGQVGESQVVVDTSEHYLIANCYFTQPNITIETIVLNTTGDGLILNNISENGAIVYLQGPGSGDVIAYNYAAHSNNTAGQYYMNNITVTHTNGYSFLLEEGNEMGNMQDDNIHGTHNFDTFFRNLLFANDPPYVETSGIQALSFMGYARFENAIGNVLGCASPTVGCTTQPSTYKATPSNASSCSSTIFNIGAECGYEWPYDEIAVNSAMLWGNYDTVNGAVQWNSSEVPSSLDAAVGYSQSLSGSGDGPYTATLSHTPCVYGNNLVVAGSTIGYDLSLNGTITGTGISSGSVNCSTGAVSITFTSTPTSPTLQYLNQTGTASAYANSLPSSHTLPNSFFLTANTAPSGGTGLSWWKVCTNYSTCSTSSTPPFPPIGPDVTSGNNTAGYANNIPAYIAWKNLPIDTSYQTSYSISGWSYNSGTQTETLTVSGLPASYNLGGEFQISGSTGGCNGTYMLTNSTTTTFSYSAATNPGCSGGSVLYPDVREFNEMVYQNDPASSPLISAPCAACFAGFLPLLRPFHRMEGR